MLDSSKLPILLVVLDGWGITNASHGNAIALARKPYFNSLVTQYPTYVLQASGEVVGLTWGEMGNSEVGHLTLGSGRIIYQSLARINKDITSRDFFSNRAFVSAIKHVKDHQSSLHLMGLVSNGGVHSHRDHLYALLEMCKQNSIERVYIHAILDGRDTDRDAGVEFIKDLQNKLIEIGVGKIATLSGRFYAMDRDNHWDRTEKAYRAIAEGKSKNMSEDPLKAIEMSYAQEVLDEEFYPTVIIDQKKPVATVQENDAVIFFNFRSDRARQMTSAFAIPGFEKFERTKYQKNLLFVTMTQYDNDFPCEVAFPPIQTSNTLSEILSREGLLQLHAAETEKYAHVTFFFNGGVEEPVLNEERILVPSPLVTSYAQKPEMSAFDLTARVLKEIAANKFHFIVVNYANADMVGHTGNLAAAIKGVETIDECLSKIVPGILEKNGTVFITADHGNAEDMVNMETGEIMKEHSKNPVPLIIVRKDLINRPTIIPIAGDVDAALNAATPSGMLADVAPTILKLLDLPQPPEMSGISIL